MSLTNLNALSRVGFSKGKPSGNGLSITLPATIFFADADQPYNMAGAEKIVLADSKGGDTTFTVAITVGGGGTLTLSVLTGLTGTGNGTSSLSYSGTLANWNTALDGADIAGLSGETASISVTMTGDTTARVKSNSISVTSYDALTVTTFSPADNATSIAVASPLTATFNWPIQLGTGDIVVKGAGGGTLETFNAATGVGDQGGTLTVSGNDLTIQCGVSMPTAFEMCVRIASTAVDILNYTAVSYAGIADDTTWSFETVASALTWDDYGPLNPIYIAHRGNYQLYPEHTDQAYSLSISESGAASIEQDVVLTSDGSLIAMHDTTVDRTTDGTGTVSALTDAYIQSINVDADDTLRSGLGDQPVPFMSDVIDTYKGTTLFNIETKVAAAEGPLVTLLKNKLVPRDQVMICSFTLADLSDAVTAGYRTMWLKSTDFTAGDITSAQSAGVDWLGCNKTASDASFTTAAASFPIAAYTVNDRNRRDELLTAGVSGFWSDDTAYLERDTALYTTSANFSRQRWLPGMQAASDAFTEVARGSWTSDTAERWGFTANSGETTYRFVRQGWACPVGDDYSNDTWKIDFTAKVNAANSSTSWGAVFIPTVAHGDTVFTSGSGNGHLLQWLQDGTLTIKQVVSGAETTLATTAGSAISPGTEISLRVTVQPSSLTIERTDITQEATTATTVGLSGNFQFGTSGLNWQASGITTAQIADTFAPEITSLSPADDATGVSLGANLVATFNEPVFFAYPGGGNVLLRVNSGGGFSTLATYTPTSTTAASDGGTGTATISGSTLTINPGSDLTEAYNYAVQIAATAIEDGAGNAFAGIADDTTWNFQASAVWTPNSLTNSIWFDFDDATTMTSDGSTQITDTGTVQTIQAKGSYSTLPQFTQTTAAAKPVWSNVGYCDFDGTDDALVLTSAIFASGMCNQDEMTVFALIDADAQGGTGKGVFCEGNDASNLPAIYAPIRCDNVNPYDQFQPFYRNDANTSTFAPTGPSTPFNTAAGLKRVGVVLKKSTTTMTLYVDGAVDITTSSWVNPGGTYSIDNACIGAYRRNSVESSLYNGKIYQIIIMPGVPTAQELSDIDDFLVTKM